jgi:TolB protein
MDVFAVNVDGTGLVRLNPPGTTTGLIDTPFLSGESWSPDGRQVTFVAAEGSFASGRRMAYVVNADGTDARAIASSEYTAVWSPSGEWIALDQPHLGSRDLFVVHPDGSGLRAITSAADGQFSFGPVWSHDGDWLLFIRGIGDAVWVMDLWIENVDGTGLVQITHDPGMYVSYGWSPSD